MPSNKDNAIQPFLPIQQFLKFIPPKIAGSACAGTVIAVGFNPWDRALYLSTTHNRPFFLKENFNHPYQGFMQVGLSRIFMSSAYFVIRDGVEKVNPYLDQMKFNEFSKKLTVGLGTGAIYGAIGNSFASVKFQMWKENKTSFLSTASFMYKHGGLKKFSNAWHTAVARDSVFGMIYEPMKDELAKQMKAHHIEPNKEKTFNAIFMCDAFSAGCATAIASPFNYVRFLQLSAHPKENPPTIKQALKQLIQKPTTSSQGLFGSVARKLQAGNGWVRVAVGMAGAQKIKTEVETRLKKYS